jgi:hypothetical protein
MEFRFEVGQDDSEHSCAGCLPGSRPPGDRKVRARERVALKRRAPVPVRLAQDSGLLMRRRRRSHHRRLSPRSISVPGGHPVPAQQAEAERPPGVARMDPVVEIRRDGCQALVGRRHAWLFTSTSHRSNPASTASTSRSQSSHRPTWQATRKDATVTAGQEGSCREDRCGPACNSRAMTLQAGRCTVVGALVDAAVGHLHRSVTGGSTW